MVPFQEFPTPGQMFLMRVQVLTASGGQWEMREFVWGSKLWKPWHLGAQIQICCRPWQPRGTLLGLWQIKTWNWILWPLWELATPLESSVFHLQWLEQAAVLINCSSSQMCPMQRSCCKQVPSKCWTPFLWVAPHPFLTWKLQNLENLCRWGKRQNSASNLPVVSPCRRCNLRASNSRWPWHWRGHPAARNPWPAAWSRMPRKLQ